MAGFFSVLTVLRSRSRSETSLRPSDSYLWHVPLLECTLSQFRLFSLWDRKRTQWATWGLIRTKKDLFWVGRLKWFHGWSQMVSFWVAVRKLLPLGAKLVSFWMVWNHRVSNRLTWSQLVLFWVACRKAPPQRAKMASFWVVWFPCG